MSAPDRRAGIGDTFAGIMDEHRQTHLQEVWLKAQRASHMAKGAPHIQRQQLYRVKAQAVSWVIENDPCGMLLTDLDFNFAGLGFRGGPLLHIKPKHLAPQARERVIQLVTGHWS